MCTHTQPHGHTQVTGSLGTERRLRDRETEREEALGCHPNNAGVATAAEFLFSRNYRAPINAIY